MVLLCLIVFFCVNIIGFYQRRRPWAKIFMVSQLFLFFGFIAMVSFDDTEHPVYYAKDKMERNDSLNIKKSERSDFGQVRK